MELNLLESKQQESAHTTLSEIKGELERLKKEQGCFTVISRPAHIEPLKEVLNIKRPRDYQHPKRARSAIKEELQKLNDKLIASWNCLTILSKKNPRSYP